MEALERYLADPEREPEYAADAVSRIDQMRPGVGELDILAEPGVSRPDRRAAARHHPAAARCGCPPGRTPDRGQPARLRAVPDHRPGGGWAGRRAVHGAPARRTPAPAPAVADGRAEDPDRGSPAGDRAADERRHLDVRAGRAGEHAGRRDRRLVPAAGRAPEPAPRPAPDREHHQRPAGRPCWRSACWRAHGAAGGGAGAVLGLAGAGRRAAACCRACAPQSVLLVPERAWR